MVVFNSLGCVMRNGDATAFNELTTYELEARTGEPYCPHG